MCFFFCSSTALLDPILRSAKIKFCLRRRWIKLPRYNLSMCYNCHNSIISVLSMPCKDFGHCLHPCLSPILSVVGARVVGAHDDEHVLELGSAKNSIMIEML